MIKFVSVCEATKLCCTIADAFSLLKTGVDFNLRKRNFVTEVAEI